MGGKKYVGQMTAGIRWQLSANSVNSYAAATVSTLKRKYVPIVLNHPMYVTDAVK